MNVVLVLSDVDGSVVLVLSNVDGDVLLVLQALTENPELVFVKPQWIHSCHDKSKLLPYQQHVVVP